MHAARVAGSPRKLAGSQNEKSQDRNEKSKTVCGNLRSRAPDHYRQQQTSQNMAVCFVLLNGSDDGCVACVWLKNA